MTPMLVPVLDVTALRTPGADMRPVADQIGAACREHGFFCVVGHGIDPVLEASLERAAQDFFALPVEEKMRIAMQHGGRAWRGYFPVGAELTSGKPDRKEGIYFGSELAATDPRVLARTPMHGANLFPTSPPELREAVLEYIEAMTSLGHAVLRGIALSLGLNADYFATSCARDPLLLFRVFHYPAVTTSEDATWGVGEHTDYGLITLLKQDEVGGLEVKHNGRWNSVPVVPGAFVCNLGDMLDRMTRGLYVSTPHRVVAPRTRDRLSFPFFFDPSYDARVEPIDGIAPPTATRAHRWDDLDLDALDGTYGAYLTAKVAKVFPSLG
ncbi:MAG: isopenicillin N synthase family oxygenase [Sandaracinaceae bacterium]|nr:isopenicillin N synthase family oxygenase [Sandaracinaceae bacterium]